MALSGTSSGSARETRSGLAAYLAELFGDEQAGVNLADALLSEYARRCTDRRSLMSYLKVHAGSLAMIECVKVVDLVMDEAGRCSDCNAAARHANSDATTPGFFHSKCERHRA